MHHGTLVPVLVPCCVNFAVCSWSSVDSTLMGQPASTNLDRNVSRWRPLLGHALAGMAA